MLAWGPRAAKCVLCALRVYTPQVETLRNPALAGKAVAVQQHQVIALAHAGMRAEPPATRAASLGAQPASLAVRVARLCPNARMRRCACSRARACIITTRAWA